MFTLFNIKNSYQRGKAFFLYWKLYAAILFISAALPLSTAKAGFCQTGETEKLRCEQAFNLLKEILSPLSKKDEKKQQPVKLQKLLPEDDVSLQKKPFKLVDGETLYIPFPTPKPKEAAPKKVNTLPTSEKKFPLGVDTVVTGGLFRNCVEPEMVSDKDVQRHKDLLSQKKFCIAEKHIRENGRIWKIITIRNLEKKNGPFFIVPHDNENSGFDAGVYGLDRHGGKLVFLETGERRSLKGQDPNRNFGYKKSLVKSCRHQEKPSPRFTKAILKGHKKKQSVIALHSNFDGWSGNGGKGTISIKRKMKNTYPFLSAINKNNRFQDEDTLIVIASKKRAFEDRKVARKVVYFTKMVGVNILVEHVSDKNNDCSLSNHVILNNLGDYYNIEVQTGDVETHKRLVDAVAHYSQ